MKQIRITHTGQIAAGATLRLPVIMGELYRSQTSERWIDEGAELVGVPVDVEGVGWLHDMFIFMDQAGTYVIEISHDGTTWRTLASLSIVASTLLTDTGRRIPARFIRFAITNSGAAATTVKDVQIHLRPS